MIRRGPTHLQHRTLRPASPAAAAHDGLEVRSSSTWCEQEQVTSAPPGRIIFIARRFSSLYPRKAPSTARFDLANAGGSSTTESKPLAVRSEYAQQVECIRLNPIHLQPQSPDSALRFRSATSSAARSNHTRHPLADPREVQRKTALIAAYIERSPCAYRAAAA